MKKVGLLKSQISPQTKIYVSSFRTALIQNDRGKTNEKWGVEKSRLHPLHGRQIGRPPVAYGAHFSSNWIYVDFFYDTLQRDICTGFLYIYILYYLDIIMYVHIFYCLFLFPRKYVYEIYLWIWPVLDIWYWEIQLEKCDSIHSQKMHR